MTRNENALIRKHGATPSSAITAPAAAGPMMREEWTMTEFSATAFTTRSGPTISTTKAWRAGLSTALIAPCTQTSARTIQGVTAPDSVRAKRPAVGTIIAVWVNV